MSDVAWNPDQGLHLVTSSGDDKNPVLKLWDLRSSTSLPLATLQGKDSIMKRTKEPINQSINQSRFCTTIITEQVTQRAFYLCLGAPQTPPSCSRVARTTRP